MARVLIATPSRQYVNPSHHHFHSTVKPLLGVHLRGNGSWGLNRGWPLNTCRGLCTLNSSFLLTSEYIVRNHVNTIIINNNIHVFECFLSVVTFILDSIVPFPNPLANLCVFKFWVAPQQGQ